MDSRFRGNDKGLEPGERRAPRRRGTTGEGGFESRPYERPEIAAHRKNGRRGVRVAGKNGATDGIEK